MLDNKTFSAGVNPHLNATVGNNGSGVSIGEARSNMDYAIGFSSAAIELIEVALTSKNIENCVDYMVYPICFNMRHAVELQLKKVWKDLSILATYRKIKLSNHMDRKIKETPSLQGKIKPFPDLNEASTHDLKIIWNLIEEYAPLIDSRYLLFIDLLTPFINDIAEMDSTGQTFRYPASNESQVHLDKTPIINIEILKVRFTNLVAILKYLEDISKEMIYEYGWSSITNSLSHFDIIKAAYHLAKFLDDEEPYYKAAKASTLKLFNISSNEYSQLTKTLTKDKTINHILKVDNKPKHADLETLIVFFDILDKVYPMEGYVKKLTQPFTNRIFDISSINGGEEIKIMRIENQAIEEIYEKLTLHQIAEIYSLYDFNKQPCYIEIFESELNTRFNELECYRINFRVEEIHDFIRHFFKKTNLIEYILMSTWKLNMKLLSYTLIEKYNLYNIPWCKELVKNEYTNGISKYNWFNSELIKLYETTEESNKTINSLRFYY